FLFVFYLNLIRTRYSHLLIYYDRDSNKSVDESILFELGLDKKQIKRNVMKLSGGQQQRVAIARALVSDAPIILADEPTGNLDSVTAGEIINILKELAQDRNKCVIVVTHSKEVADSADIILELSGKKLKKVNKMNLEVE
ncbi:ATP-binding cassette domain-containing protein, partial [Streptococcus agalactiae]|uniref:ATP-binding cassette domain-containing protein n=1 Tax=Streptococcus agalactiae TaxID=1311 RepID=UPI003642986A